MPLKRLLLSVGLLIAVPPSPAGAVDIPSDTLVSFSREVIPVLTRAGCNAGACHGTPTGKNGFRLSLRGYDPHLDFQNLTRDAAGRRINGTDPDASLILLKASGRVPHGGGRRFAPDSYMARVLRGWIAQGARDDSAAAARVTRLEVTPQRRILEATTGSPGNNSQQLRVVAHFSDGNRRDVTALARFTVNDESVAQVTQEGLVEKRSQGEVAVIVEYLSTMATTQIIFLEPAPHFAWPNPAERNFIDQHLFAKLRLLRIAPSAAASDEEFLRRAFLDAIGKLPAPDEVRRFLADSDPEKRGKLIDALLDRPEFADWWSLKWTDRLGCNQRFVGKIGALKYRAWIHQVIAGNLPEDEFVRRIVTAQGGNYEHPPAGFYRRLRDPQVRAEEIAQLFLGVRIGCAKCHNHPGERWTQDDYHRLAAFFPRVKYRDGPFFLQQYDKEETVFVTRDGEVKHPRTGDVLAPKFLGGAEPAIGAEVDRREVFARWLTARENPFFARAAVNRVWYHLFGRGIVEPLDDFRSTNPPTNPELLDALAGDFVRHGFDRKHLIRTIMRSHTYQLSSKPTPTNRDDEKYFSHARIRLLQAEQLLDAVASATGMAEKFPGLPLGTPAVALPDGEYKHPFLEAFGRPARAMACECERDPETNLGQALHLVGGRVVQDKIRSDTGRVAQLLTAGKSNAAVVEELFLATLARFPTEAERQLLVKRLIAPGADRRRVAEDILWALINHNEFLFQH